MRYANNQSIGYGYSHKGFVHKEVAKLDAFGNPPKVVRRTAQEYHAEVVMCLAGAIAEAKLLGKTNWRPLASSSDMSIAREFRKELGEAAKSWQHYEQEASTLVDKFWAMIEAVAARLTKVGFIGTYELDCICCRVARQQSPKSWE
jgi:hypothetical protein